MTSSNQHRTTWSPEFRRRLGRVGLVGADLRGVRDLRERPPHRDHQHGRPGEAEPERRDDAPALGDQPAQERPEREPTDRSVVAAIRESVAYWAPHTKIGFN